MPAVNPDAVTVVGVPAVAVMLGVAGGVHDTVNVASSAVSFVTLPVCHTRSHALRLAPFVHSTVFGALTGLVVPARTPESHTASTSGVDEAAGAISI